MQSPPRISVLLAVHNGERFLREAIQSVIEQTYRNFELLIGFNGTIDQSRTIARAIIDDRVRIFDYGTDKGKAKTLNKLLKEASGEWICIQDDDDVWLKEKLVTQVRLAERYDVIGTFIEYIDADGRMIGAPKLARSNSAIRRRSLAGINQIANTSSMIRGTALKSANGWDENFDGIEDYDLWLRLMRRGYKFRNIPRVLVRHRLHARSNFNTRSYDLSAILAADRI